jgi:hypothetical protein
MNPVGSRVRARLRAFPHASRACARQVPAVATPSHACPVMRCCTDQEPPVWEVTWCTENVARRRVFRSRADAKALTETVAARCCQHEPKK